MDNFARITIIKPSQGGCSGRYRYLMRLRENEKHFEDLICADQNFSFEEFKKLDEFEIAKKNKRSGRELIIALPNEIENQSKDEIKKLISEIISEIIPTGLPYAYAVHQNSKRENLHVHILFGERKISRETQYKKYRQDIWAKEDGSRALKKVDRHHIMHAKGDYQKDKDGNLIVVSEGISFSDKDRKPHSREFVVEVKAKTKTILEKYGYQISTIDEKPNYYIPQVHEGDGKYIRNSELIRRNRIIKEWNDSLHILKEDEKKKLFERFYERKKDKKEVFNWLRTNLRKVKKKYDEILSYIKKKKEAVKKYAHIYRSERDDRRDNREYSSSFEEDRLERSRLITRVSGRLERRISKRNDLVSAGGIGEIRFSDDSVLNGSSRAKQSTDSQNRADDQGIASELERIISSGVEAMLEYERKRNRRIEEEERLTTEREYISEKRDEFYRDDYFRGIQNDLESDKRESEELDDDWGLSL